MLNKCIFTGRLGADPEKTVTNTGKVVTRFSIPLANPYKREEDPTEWMQFEVWNKSAEYIANYAKKGDLVEVDGRLRNQTYQKDGQKRYRSFVAVDRVSILESRSRRNDSESTAPAQQHTPAQTPSPPAPAPAPAEPAAQPASDQFEDLFENFNFN